MKKPKTNYYLGEVEEHNGEYEYNIKYLFKTSGKPEEYNDHVAKVWYGNENPEKDEYGYQQDDVIMTCAGSVQKISESHFKVMKRYLLVM